jgi:octaprenyl-diphosphate synthase
MNLTNLKEIQAPVTDLLEETGNILIERVKSDVMIIDKITNLAPVSRGKKIRSTLMFLLAGLNGTLRPELEHPAISASIEMFHLSSLVHDDVVDNSQFRRGKETLNNHLGNHMTVLWGDYLFISAFTALNRIGKKVLMDIILNAARLMVEGQIIELAKTFDYGLEEETYLDIINKKTSSLFAAVTHITAALKEESEAMAREYYQFGMDFGTIFQISDDMLDIFSDKSGKDRFSDLKEGKITLPFILLQRECHKDIAHHYNENDPEKLLAVFEECNTKALCMEAIDTYYKRAVAFVDRFPDSIYKESLLKLLDFIKYRDY